MRAAILALLLAGCAAPEVKPPPAMLRVRPVCDGSLLLGLVVASTGGGVWSVEFDPSEACPRGI